MIKMLPDSGKIETYNGDLREMVTEKWQPLVGNRPVYTHCPKHEDVNRPSLAVYADHAYCYTCHAYFSPRDFSAQYTSVQLTAAKLWGGGSDHKRGSRQSVNPEALAEASHELLLRNPEKRKWLHRRGTTDSTIKTLLLGHNGPAYTIPIFDASGKIVSVRFRRDDTECPEAPKYWGLRGLNGVQWYGHFPRVYDKTLVMTEGEFDAILLLQEEIPTFTLTNGARAGDNLRWTTPLQTVNRLVFCRDYDPPGQAATASLCEKLHAEFPALELVVLPWPEVPAKDVTELWQSFPDVFAQVIGRLSNLVSEKASA